jgi:hypothetical protein
MCCVILMQSFKKYATDTKEIYLLIVKQHDGHLKFVFIYKFIMTGEPLELDLNFIWI